MGRKIPTRRHAVRRACNLRIGHRRPGYQTTVYGWLRIAGICPPRPDEVGGELLENIRILAGYLERYAGGDWSAAGLV